MGRIYFSIAKVNSAFTLLLILSLLLCAAACNVPTATPLPPPTQTSSPTATVVSQPAAGPQAVTILVDDAYKPYSYFADGQVRGMYVDVLRAVFARMDGYAVTLEAVPWPRGKKMMEEGTGLGLAPAFFHGHDWPYLYPYSLPFYTETIIAVCTAENLAQPRPNWPDDYKGLIIGNVAGFSGWGGEAFYKLVEAKQIFYEEAPSSSSNILKLGAQRVDCVMMEERAFDYEYKRLRESGEYEETYAEAVKGAVIGTDPVYIGYSKTARTKGLYPFQDDFMQTFDSILYTMLKSGEVSEIMDAYQE